jgi:hypothetical protein
MTASYHQIHRMKKNLLVAISAAILFCSTGSSTYAQKDSALIKRITKDFCAAFTKKDPKDLKDGNMEVEMGLIIIDIIGKYSDDIKKEWKLSMDSEEDMEKIGEKIGLDAALNCPAFRTYMMNNLDSFSDDDEISGQKTAIGIFTSLQTGQFSYVTIRSNSGKEEKYWWFGHFTGADELIEDPSKFKSKSIEVRYKEMELYDSALKEYRKIKVLTGLSLED